MITSTLHRSDDKRWKKEKKEKRKGLMNEQFQPITLEKHYVCTYLACERAFLKHSCPHYREMNNALAVKVFIDSKSFHLYE